MEPLAISASHFIKRDFPLIVRDLAASHEPPQITVSRDVIESVVMHAGMGDMRCHVRDGVLSPNLQQLLIARRFKCQDRHAVLKALRPIGPAAGGVFSPPR